VQPIERIHTLLLMRKRVDSEAGMRDPAGHRARRPNGNGLMGTLWERYGNAMGTLWERYGNERSVRTLIC
jgi:hypothetical protein